MALDHRRLGTSLQKLEPPWPSALLTNLMQTHAFVGRFLPLMEIVMVQDEGRFVVGSTLSTVERRRVVQQIVACLENRSASSATV